MVSLYQCCPIPNFYLTFICHLKSFFAPCLFLSALACGFSSDGESSVWTSLWRCISYTWSAAGSITPIFQPPCHGGWLTWPAWPSWRSSASTCACGQSSEPSLSTRTQIQPMRTVYRLMCHSWCVQGCASAGLACWQMLLWFSGRMSRSDDVLFTSLYLIRMTMVHVRFMLHRMITLRIPSIALWWNSHHFKITIVIILI